jgi:ParB family chromosome partitioning protein
MAAKLRLGRGLDALLPPEEASPAKKAAAAWGTLHDGPAGQNAGQNALQNGMVPGTGPVPGGEISLPLEKLRANPQQPRKNFDEEALQELAASIREHGIIQPIVAEAAGDGTYVIIAGERRSRAARLAGLTTVPVLIRSYAAEERMEISLIENIQRADLNPVEEAQAYRQLMALTGLSQDDMALKVGKNRSTVANTLRLLKLPQAMLEALEGGGLSPGHGRALLSIPDKKNQEALFRNILARGLSVRDAERQAALLGTKPGKEAPPEGTLEVPAASRRDPELNTIEQKFIDTLGTKVSIDGNLTKGKIHIEYYSMEDLERLLELLGG